MPKKKTKKSINPEIRISSSVTGEKYISIRDNGKFTVQMGSRNNYIYIGTYETLEDAVNCRDKYLESIEDEN